VAAKSERQAALLKSGAQLTVVLAEAALHQQVGGQEVMTEQLTHLAENGNVQVLPFCQGAHAASSSGPMTIVRLGNVSGLGAVRVPDLSGGYCLTSPADVACHVKAFTMLRGQALTPYRSRKLIGNLAGSSYGMPEQ
jgi:uncharacterized protein DUF5753